MLRTGATIGLIVLVGILVMMAPASAQVPDTGFSVSNPKFADYYQHRGGARILGYPISREFDLLGTRVQFFQRAVLQLQPNGSVALLNILDEGVLPYNRINGSTFPEPNSAVIQSAPSPAEPNYAARAIDFVRAFAPDQWEGMNTNFFYTFMNTVSYQEAFPRGDGNPGLLPLINLEIWGLPTSKPAYDPNNGGFVYLRFQRGIMHFDKTNGLTQGILIGDYLKSVITGQNLPGDLDQQASGSRLYRQYSNASAFGLARPNDLPATNLFAAFERDGVVLPTPQPTATPLPGPAAPGGAAAPVRPASIAIVGNDWFTEQTQWALDRLSTKASGHYQNVRDFVYRIEQASTSEVDIPNRTIRAREADAFPSDWRFNRDNQVEWFAGLIVHAAVHIEQAHFGRASSGPDAEREARIRQRDALGLIETTSPGGQFSNLILDILNGKEATWGEWEAPRDPLPTSTPEPTPTS